jgi:hypothetical protein
MVSHSFCGFMPSMTARAAFISISSGKVLLRVWSALEKASDLRLDDYR